MDFKRSTVLLLCGIASIAAGGAAATTRPPADSGAKFWAYQPVSDPATPTVKDAGWAHNDVDRFILSRLESQGLVPVADAEPAALVRRLYFDLIGLPPTPAQLDDYLNDPSADRYEKLVDRLLAAPQFGQRWGRHWLDVARYGESLTLRGFVLKDAWRYRDYVIDAFNGDRPYDQFMREQVAGDLLPAATTEDRRRQLTGTAFLMLGNHNLEEQDKKQLEMDVVDEQIGAISTAFLAQTIGCARCHDHKFDPITARDYYALAGILHSTQALEHANVSKWLDIPLPMDPGREQAVRKHEDEVAALQARISLAKKSLLAGKAAGGAVLAVADLPGLVLDDTQARRVGAWKVSKSVRPYIGQGYLTDDGDRAETKTLTFQPEFSETARYEVRLAYTAAPNRATNVHVTVFSADGEKDLTVDQRRQPPIDGHFVSLGQYTFDKTSQGFVLISSENANGHVTVDALQFVPPESGTVASGEATTSPPTPAPPPSAQGVKQMEAELKKLVAAGPFRDTIISVRESKEIADARVNLRGSVHSLGEVVPRGFPKVIAAFQTLAIPPGQSGRLQLAGWLSDPRNPLPARVIANRAWHWLMGAGIVRTPDNFGVTGEQPSNPQLLDHLATAFVADGWSVKSLVRRIVLSHAYQLSTADDASALSADPENRLEWRMNRRRLDAECIRDAMLLVSGQLDPGTGGPTFKAGLTSDFGFKQTSLRRSVYLPVFRNAMPDIFEAFDFADPSVSTGRRNVSTVAPQALFMLNNPFVIEQSRRTAERLLGDFKGGDEAARLVNAYRLVLGRSPTRAESELSLKFLQSSGDRVEGWTQLVHALFASVDFRYEN